MMRYLSVCSGIEAATVAWHPLGWRPAAFSEIEAFPRAVLAHHYPDVPCHGDFTTIGADDYGAIDLLVGGTPCQSFSIAGLRGGLADDRGNLALEFLRLADRKRPRWVAWENAPGVLSSNGGRDFGSILGGLVELGYGFAYRVLDAQHFGVPQRRRRVFVVGYLGDWRRAGAVLFERHGLSGYPAPRREAGKGTAVGALAGTSPGGGWRVGADEAAAGQLVAADVAATLPAGGNSTGGNRYPGMSAETCGSMLVAHSLRGEGFDASEDGTGRGTPLIPVCVHSDAIGRDGSALTPSLDAEGRIRLRDAGLGVLDDGTSYNLTTGQPHAICFSAKDHGADAMHDLSPTLRAGGHSGSHANAGVMPAIAFSIMPMNSGKDYVARETEVAQPIMAGGPVGGNQGGDFIAVGFDSRMRGAEPAVGRPERPPQSMIERTGAIDATKPWNVATASAVRRLTPRECERLQGFPDDYTLIPYRGKPAADGPRYKALGNSMAVPVMRWIGERIALVDAIQSERAAA